MSGCQVGGLLQKRGEKEDILPQKEDIIPYHLVHNKQKSIKIGAESSTGRGGLDSFFT